MTVPTGDISQTAPEWFRALMSDSDHTAAGSGPGCREILDRKRCERLGDRPAGIVLEIGKDRMHPCGPSAEDITCRTAEASGRIAVSAVEPRRAFADNRRRMPASRLLVIGDIAWDILVRPEREPIWGSDVFGTVELLPGGSAANVAVWAQRLGASVTLAGKLGDDALGELMMRHLAAEGVAARVVTVAGGATTRVGIYVRPDGEHGFVTDHTQALRFDAGDAPVELLDQADAVFVAGYAIYMSESADFLNRLLAEARRRAIPIAFDPSSFALIRLYGPDRLLAELGRLDVVMANEDEARELAGGGAVEALLTHARLVVMKKGAEGATAFGGGRPVTVPAAAVDVMDTTGAGDAFDAAFLVEYLAHRDVEAALAAANRLGAHVAGRLGAQTR
jgi:sugar/nucleoside kinase (ribokinase family)